MSRLLYIGPDAGIGAIGDYADDFAAAVRTHFDEVIEYRHGSPGSDGVADLRRERDEIAQLARTVDVVHCELSGGSLASFWTTMGLREVPVTATVHDPPGLGVVASAH